MAGPITCERCQTVAQSLPAGDIPLGWEGNVAHPVCPNCQFAEWHPHCTSLIDYQDGEVVDIAVIPADEWRGEVMYCGWLDKTVSWLDGEDPPEGWRCPSCGGTAFEGAHLPGWSTVGEDQP